MAGIPRSLLKNWADPCVVAPAVALSPVAISVGAGSSAGQSAAAGDVQQTPRSLLNNLRGNPTQGRWSQLTPVAARLLCGA
jgi:hypothetical protein